MRGPLQGVPHIGGTNPLPTMSVTTQKPTILIVDDELSTRLVIRQALLSGDFTVVEATGGAEAIGLIGSRQPLLVVMDVNMPGMSGFETVAKMRGVGISIPVMMVTSYDQIEDRVRGLEAGADDYLVKPFDAREFLARVRALVRRAVVRGPEKALRAGRVIEVGQAIIDLGAKRASMGGVPLALTKTEYAILDCLAQSPGRSITRDQMLREVWGYAGETNTRTVETHVWRLRKKIGDAGETNCTIETRSGMGYCLSPEVLRPMALAS